MAEFSLVDLGKLTKPANTLINKVSDAVGGVFRPHQIVRIATAEAQASIILAQSEIEITDLKRRAMHRFVEEEAKRQGNIEAITRAALPLLKESSAPEGMNNDWIANFFDKSRIVSDEEMQRVWSAVLAGEANGPGAFSRKTINLLADMDRRDAEMFAVLCGFTWEIGEVNPFIIDLNDSIYTTNGVNLTSLMQLQSLGLVVLNISESFHQSDLPIPIYVHHHGRHVELSHHDDAMNSMEVGHVVFTRAGKELATVCEAAPAPGFFNYVISRWRGERIFSSELREGEMFPR